jgi:hypothetical protein
MGKKKVDRLLFVYDANSGVLGAIVDSARKLMTLKGCALCTITHGITGEKGEWKECRDELGVPVEYLHRDEIQGDLEKVVRNNLPCIVAEAGGTFVLLVTRDVLERCNGSVPDLKGKILYYAGARDLRLG